MPRTPPAAALSVLALVGLAGAAAAGPAHDDDHADVGVSPSFALFPTHEEVLGTMEEYASHPWVTLHTLGASGAGRPLLVAEITDPASDVPLDERIVTFIFTQQHGNEPAGTPAALALLERITSGDPIAATLADQVLLLLPMANPDGATAETRGNADGVDVNRDHIGLATPEARVLHDALHRWDVHVAMDHHEYSGVGLGQPMPVRLYDYDLTTLFPVHGNVRTPTLEAARGLMYDGIWPHAEADGFTANEYGEQTVAGVPVQQVAGGPDPGIMRNHLGLHHIAGLLVETRVDALPNPFHDAQRRTAIHASVMDATLEYAHEHAAALIAAKRAAEADTLAEPHTEYLEGDNRGPLAPAYALPAATPAAGIVASHGLPPGVPHGDSLVFPMLHALQGHAAAVLHPASTRAVAPDAVAAEPMPATDAPVEATGASETPLLPLAALVSIVVASMVVPRRRAP